MDKDESDFKSIEELFEILEEVEAFLKDTTKKEKTQKFREKIKSRLPNQRKVA